MCRRWFVLFLLAVGLLSALLAAYRPFGKSPTETAAPSAQAATYSGNATPPPDPRLTFPTGYLNIHPEVRYVGDQACARCHRRITDSYRRHPMGRSLAPVAQAVEAGRYGPDTHNPFEAFGFVYSVVRDGSRLVHIGNCRDRNGVPFAEHRAEVSYVLGSGTRGYSYLVEREGWLYQSPIAWYARAARWDLQPTVGDPFTQHQHFARPIPDECVACHANRIEPVEGSVNRYQQPIFKGHAIGCERCHGPGELHVQRHERREAPRGEDNTIVNPGKLEPRLREAVCEQCHLLGEVRVLRRGRQVLDFRPGLPLELFKAAFVLAPEVRDESRSVGQTEQMYASRCFRESQRELGCVSCHDPHRVPSAAERVSYYQQRCLNCHGDKSCALPRPQRLEKSPEDSCIDCHMPRAASSNVAHTANTDHRVVRRPGDNPAWLNPPPRLAPGIPLLAFHGERVRQHDPEVARDLGVALIRLVETGSIGKNFHVEDVALPLLERSLTPDDLPGWRAKGYALWLQGRQVEALRIFATIVSQVPRDEETLALAAQLSAELQDWKQSAAHWERVVELNPYSSRYHLSFARVLAAQGDWEGVLRQCRNALGLNPAHLGTRQLLVQAAFQKADRRLAEGEFELLLRCAAPEDQAGLRAWFSRLR